MIPIGTSTPVPGNALAASRFLQSRPTASQPFSLIFHDAQSSPAQARPENVRPENDTPDNDRPEIEERKTPAVRKAGASPKQPSADPQSAQPQNQIVPIAGRQPLPFLLLLSLSLERSQDPSQGDRAVGDSTSDDGLTNASATSNAPATANAGGAGNASPQGAADGAAQLSPELPPLAFSMNLQKAGPSDRKPEGPGQRDPGTSEHTLLPGLAANSAVGDLENSPSGNGSDRSGTQEEQSANPKAAPMPDSKQDATPAINSSAVHSDVPALQSYVNAPTGSTGGAASQQGPVKAAADARPVVPTEPPLPPAPATPRQIELTVPNDAGHQVDIRVSQRGSGVQVVVRTPDGDLAQSLRHNLSELSESLSRNGLREEAVHTAPSHSSGEGDRGETPRNGGQRQPQRHPVPQDHSNPPGGQKDRRAAAFNEIIYAEKGKL